MPDIFRIISVKNPLMVSFVSVVISPSIMTLKSLVHILTERYLLRQMFQRMIQDSYRAVFDIIVVWKLDRFSRDR